MFETVGNRVGSIGSLGEPETPKLLEAIQTRVGIRTWFNRITWGPCKSGIRAEFLFKIFLEYAIHKNVE